MSNNNLSTLNEASSSSMATPAVVRTTTPVVFEYVAEQSILDRLKCSICHDPFVEPLAFACKHVYCKHCITPLLAAAAAAADGSSPCPTCRQPISLNSSREGDATLLGSRRKSILLLLLLIIFCLCSFSR